MFSLAVAEIRWGKW